MLLCLISYNKYISSYTVNNTSSMSEHFISDAIELIKEESNSTKLAFLWSDDFGRRALSHDEYVKHVLLRYKYRSLHKAKEALAEYRKEMAKKYMVGMVVEEVEFMYRRDFFHVLYFKFFWVLAGFLIIQVKIRFWSAYIRALLKSLVAIQNEYLEKTSRRSWELSKDQLLLTLWSLEEKGDGLGPQTADSKARTCESSLADSSSEQTERACYASDRNDTEEDGRAGAKEQDSPQFGYSHIAEESFIRTEADVSLLV